MCVIVYKPCRVAMPGERLLQAAWARNPHGAGLAVLHRGEVEIHKGYMDFDSFLDAARRHTRKADRVAYHFRFATSGGIRPGACHPFPVSASIDDLNALDISAPMAFIHNGVISSGTRDMSDTMLYVRHNLSAYCASGLPMRTVRELVAEDTFGSRTLVFDGISNRAHMTGGWQQDGSGLFFSNMNFLSRGMPCRVAAKGAALDRIVGKA